MPPDNRRIVCEEEQEGRPSQGVGGWGSGEETHWPRKHTVCVCVCVHACVCVCVMITD